MTEHLPECPPEVWCICSYLRDCEERVHKIAYAQDLGAGSDEHGQHEAGFVKGYAAALNAARDVVAGLPEYRMRDTCVSAIDELREEKK